ncbi:MAG: 50S ribosomal protein L30 [Sandaracinaceae bacterium]|nr:50S ribosomal protein L30 [Sandaracinaceae bacterium]
MSKKLKVTQIRGLQGRPETQRRTIAGLGLRGINKSVVVDNTPAFRGMIKKVIHLVKVEEIDV